MLAPTPETISKYMRWVILIFLVYAFAHTLFGPKKIMVHPVTAATDKTKDCDGNNATLAETFQTFAFPLIPSYTPSLRIKDTKLGAGEAAMCGQHATLRYEYATQNGGVIFSNLAPTAAPETVRIGAGELLPGLERSLIGMPVGTERTVIIPPVLAFGGVKDVHKLRGSEHFLNIPADIITAKAELLSLTPAMPTSPMPIRIINGLFGTSDPVQCGDTVSADINIWKLDGTQVYTTNGKGPLTFTLGQSQLPVGIEESVIGMRIGGQRRIILPPAYNKPLDPSTDKPSLMADVILPNEIVLVELMLHPVTAVKPLAAAPVPQATAAPVSVPQVAVPAPSTYVTPAPTTPATPAASAPFAPVTTAPPEPVH